MTLSFTSSEDPISTRRSPRFATIPRFSANATPEELVEAVRSVGCAIVENFLPEAAAHAQKELEPYLSRVPTSLGSFNGLLTRRTMRLVVKSLATHEMITDPLIQRSLTELFRGEAYHHQLHFTEAVRIEPGEKAQSLHRDDGPFPFRHPSPPSVINTIWALDDFTEENGSTRVIPYSHRWVDGRRGHPSETVPVVMPRGSFMMMDAALLHGGGENKSTRSRTGLIIAYSLGWLRPHENPQLAVPPHVAKMLAPELADLLGYKTHGFLGTYEGTQPSVLFSAGDNEIFPAEDLYGEELEQLTIRRR
jgi:ectoine hydroxylase-related dioxygenase (phytanoyl-CoA dioxygenase family)